MRGGFLVSLLLRVQNVGDVIDRLQVAYVCSTTLWSHGDVKMGY